MKHDKSKYNPYVPSVREAGRILNYIRNHSSPRISLSEISRELGIPKSKCYTILNTLKEFHLISKDPKTKLYSLGMGLVYLARSVLDNLNVRDISDKPLQDLAIGTCSSALLGLISGNYLFIVNKHEGNQTLGLSIPVGHRFHITFGAHGRIIFAYMDQEEREALLSGKKLYFYRDGKLPPRELFQKEIEKWKTQGFASDLGEMQLGINAISSPVFALNNKITGAVILVGAFPKKYQKKYGIMTVSTANRISEKLGASKRLP